MSNDGGYEGDSCYHVATPQVDPGAAGVFVWAIADIGCYVCRTRRVQAELDAYERNLSRIAQEEAYRPDDPDGFRLVHHALHEARREGREIRFAVVEMCALEELTDRVRFWKSALKPNLHGPRPR